MEITPLAYNQTTQEALFGIPAERNPRYVTYWTALDNYEPLRRGESGRLVEYEPGEPWASGGAPWYMLATDRSDMRDLSRAVFLIDDGTTVQAYFAGGRHDGRGGSAVYPDGCEPHVILMPFPVNPDGRTRPDDGDVIDFSGWMLGPRRAYHLKITRA